MGMESAFCGVAVVVGCFCLWCAYFLYLVKRNGMECKAGKKRKAERKERKHGTVQDMSICTSDIYVRYA
jgi:hypothetical protein